MPVNQAALAEPEGQACCGGVSAARKAVMQMGGPFRLMCMLRVVDAFDEGTSTWQAWQNAMCRAVLYGEEHDGQPLGRVKEEQQQQHRTVVVALLSAIPYGLAALGMVVSLRFMLRPLRQYDLVQRVAHQ